MSWITDIARAEIVGLKSYSHASWEPGLERLHANELPWRALGDNSDAGLNRYPEPQPRELIERLASLYGVACENVLAGRGSDEIIDLLVRAFCRAGQDSVVICPPTFGMYSVAAHIQGAKVVEAPLLASQGFALDESGLFDRCTPDVKLVFLCSPNNPTGNLLDRDAVLRIAKRLEGRAILAMDEAYIEFAGQTSGVGNAADAVNPVSLVGEIGQLPHMAILRTLSKAHGLAGARCGTLIADPELVTLLRKIIPPYAIPQLTVEAALEMLQGPQLAVMRARIEEVRGERKRVSAALSGSTNTIRVWPSDANFILAEFKDADRALSAARSANLLIRDVRAQPGLSRALRISIGTPEQNSRLIEALR
jgi:histidinol-phosphate aminotransferase